MLSMTLIAAALAADGEPAPQRRSRGFAVVELFTSEGCSSCPPADVLLSDLVLEAKEKDVAIYAVGFHVPWWDNAAWDDRFSQEAYGERQQDYGDQLGLEAIYTPQVVVNGRAQYVGSDTTKVRSAVVRALAMPPGASLTLTPARPGDGSLTVQIAARELAGGSLEGVTAHVVVVEDGLMSSVRGGENRGKSLQHDGVARAFNATSAAAEASVTLALPDGLNPARARVIGWLQRDRDGVILAAAEAPFPAAFPAAPPAAAAD